MDHFIIHIFQKHWIKINCLELAFAIKFSTCEFSVLVNIKLNFDKYSFPLQFNVNSLKKVSVFPFTLLHFWPNCCEPHFCKLSTEISIIQASQAI